MGQSRWKAIVGPTRPRFLILTPVCVSLGLSTAVWTGFTVSINHVFIVLVGAVAAHAGVNALNEYADFRSGLDFWTRQTPFSGGTKTLVLNPVYAPYTLYTGVVCLAITAAVGAYFLWLRGWGLLPLGLLGLVTIVAYTPLLTRSAVLCLVAPGLGFGPLMVVGTHFALTGSYSWTAFAASLVPFFLVDNLLFLNQFPDLEADKAARRNHLLIRIGRRKGAWVYVLQNTLAYGSLVAGWSVGLLPSGALLGLLSLVVAVPTSWRVLRDFDDTQRLLPAMVGNVVVNLTTPVLMALGVLLARP